MNHLAAAALKLRTVLCTALISITASIAIGQTDDAGARIDRLFDASGGSAWQPIVEQELLSVLFPENAAAAKASGRLGFTAVAPVHEIGFLGLGSTVTIFPFCRIRSPSRW